MDYENFDFREKYNEIMYDERDVIEKFLKDQYDLRYGRQRDTWHFEPAVKMMMTDGEHVSLTDIKLDTNVFVMFSVIDSESKRKEYECGYFAYGELSKVIEALPDADEIVRKNAINDISEQIKNLRIDMLLEEYPFNYEVGGNVYNVYNYNMSGDEIRLLSNGGKVLILDGIPLEMLTAFRDHINIEVLHLSDEYKKVMEILSLEPNMCKSVDEYDKNNNESVTFTIDSTDLEFDLISIKRDSVGNLTLFGRDFDNIEDCIELTEKDIKKEYLAEILKWMKPKYSDIMDTYNAHNPELVRKINSAWRDDKYHNSFSEILLALLYRDHEEYIEKYGEVEDYSVDYAMAHAHEIMEGVCDDLDLETILSFIRYKED